LLAINASATWRNRLSTVVIGAFRDGRHRPTAARGVGVVARGVVAGPHTLFRWESARRRAMVLQPRLLELESSLVVTDLGPVLVPASPR
jgi:hypothetical protein